MFVYDILINLSCKLFKLFKILTIYIYHSDQEMWAILGYILTLILSYGVYKNIQSSQQPEVSMTMGMLQLKFNDGPMRGKVWATCISRSLFPLIQEQPFTVNTKFLINQEWDNNFQIMTFQKSPNLNCHQYLYLIDQGQLFTSNKLQIQQISAAQKIVAPFGHKIIDQKQNQNAINSNFFVIFVKGNSFTDTPIVRLNFASIQYLSKLLNPLIYLSILSIVGIIILIVNKEEVNEDYMSNVFKEYGLSLLINLAIMLFVFFNSQNLCRIQTITLMKVLVLILFLKKNQIAANWIIIFIALYIVCTFSVGFIQLLYIFLMGLMLCTISKVSFNIKIFSGLTLFSIGYVLINPLFLHDAKLQIQTLFWITLSVTPCFIEFMSFIDYQKKQNGAIRLQSDQTSINLAFKGPNTL